jgi:hypothetical protein
MIELIDVENSYLPSVLHLLTFQMPKFLFQRH